MKERDVFYDAVEVVASITCHGCKKVHSEHSQDDWTFIDSIILKGWRAVPASGYCYCPTCSSKKLKHKTIVNPPSKRINK